MPYQLPRNGAEAVVSGTFPWMFKASEVAKNMKSIFHDHQIYFIYLLYICQNNSIYIIYIRYILYVFFAKIHGTLSHHHVHLDFGTWRAHSCRRCSRAETSPGAKPPMGKDTSTSCHRVTNCLPKWVNIRDETY